MEYTLNRTDEGLLKARFDAPKWRHGDELIRHVKKAFRAVVMDKAEGPDARTWTLLVENVELVVDQDDMGDIFLHAKEQRGEQLVVRIAQSVERGV